eukprot:CAMPEP_0115846502 /NCGR_PEP_ID=MMETSP0287-20121206/9894_1 /TAXON_ID=412157 /ORGANISM="Chrysochromulina rotalis, Strain UIO044" /LENGTH=195 /DNA_ID=CAMNT_0003300295 /DNA_START=211 /DNA_END=798 /DNA_ORIENTATION=-
MGTLIAKPGERMPCVVHFVIMIVAVVLLAVGGGYCRSSGRNTGCSNGATMTRSCMWDEQEHTDYQVAYVGHFMAGCVLISSWILDGLSLPSWLWSATRATPEALSCAYSSKPLWPRHMGLIAIAWLVMCITWMGVANWSTNPHSGELGITEIAGILAVEGVLIFAIAYIAGAAGRQLWPTEAVEKPAPTGIAFEP